MLLINLNKRTNSVTSDISMKLIEKNAIIKSNFKINAQTNVLTTKDKINKNRTKLCILFRKYFKTFKSFNKYSITLEKRYKMTQL